MSQIQTMRALDIFRYLIGGRNTIERIAATPWAWVVGLVLVLSAGIARNYDHLDLLRDPEWVLGPIVVSLVSTLFIYLFLLKVLRSRKKGDLLEAPQSGKSLLTFLNLVWLTAPCAWVYGIPVESFTDLLTATKWNIGFLAVVSIWRVFLITRAVTILSGAPWLRVFMFVLTPAAIEMLVGSFYDNFNRSLVVSMGGVRMPPHDALLLKVSGFMVNGSTIVVVIGMVFLFTLRGPAQRALCRPAGAFPYGALLMALVAFALWAAAAIPMHHGVSNRHRMEELIDRREYAAAAAFAASKQRSDFSGMHYLPPDPVKYSLMDQLMMLRYLDDEAPSWLREELINNAFEASKYQQEMDSYVLEIIEDYIPELQQRLKEHAAALRAKSHRTDDENRWLDSFGALTE